jgi:DNA (cytosine-5)-methyltransferase 1
MHEANHPGTPHPQQHLADRPARRDRRRPVALAWFSPDCKHFSKAKGGKPARRASAISPGSSCSGRSEASSRDVILLENVEEFRTWGPLDDEGKPIKARAGETFAKWCKELRAGYKLQFRELRACDYGAPTIRKRFFMIARCDGSRSSGRSRPTASPARPRC